MAGRAIDPDLLARAEQLLDDPNVSYATVSRETGISTDTLSRRFPRDRRPGTSRPAPGPSFFDEPQQAAKPADPMPGSRGGGGRQRSARRRKVEAGPSDEQLFDLLRKLAKSPAILTKTVVRCDYCTYHFIESADSVANELMDLAQDEPDLREALEWIWREWRKLAWASALGGWIGVPLMHHAMPDRWYGLAVLLAGMPPRETSSRDGHVHARPAPAASAFTPPPASSNGHAEDVEGAMAAEAFGPAMMDLGSMSISEIITQAQAMGVDLAAFGITQDQVAELLAADGHTVVAVDVNDPATDHPAQTDDDDQGHKDAGTPEDFIEADPTAAAELGLEIIEDIEPDGAHTPQADEAAALAADPNPDVGSA